MGKLLSSENRIPREPWTDANAALNAALDGFAAQYPLTKTSAYIGWASPGEPNDSIFVVSSETDGEHWHSSCPDRMKYLARLLWCLPDTLRNPFAEEFARLTEERKAASAKKLG